VLSRPRPPALEGEVHVWRTARPEWESSDDLLCTVLAGYLGTDPAAVELRRGANGKPFLAGLWPGEEPASGSMPRLHFNLSHSGDLALIAVAEREVGVDVERIRPLRSTAFYEGWARHEATVKCLGTGLTGRRPVPEPPVAMRMLDVEVGFVAALAVAGEEVPPVRLSAFEAAHAYDYTKK
jgi:phosphopantetheinyl transferase